MLRTTVPNAVALPGGRVFLFDGLLRRAENPDEIAGVLAHELGHIANRDSLRKLIQTGGTSFLFGLFFGDVSGSAAAIFAARSLIDASHSREAETRADTYAIATMGALGRPARPAGDLMQRITGTGKNSTTILSSHPMTAERRARMEREGVKTSGAELLSFGEWRALKNICNKRE